MIHFAIICAIFATAWLLNRKLRRNSDVWATHKHLDHTPMEQSCTTVACEPHELHRKY